MAGGLPEKKNKRQNTDFEIIVIIAGTAHTTPVKTSSTASPFGSK